MKAASIVMSSRDCQEITDYSRLAGKLEGWIRLCHEQDADIAVLPALLGCLFDDPETYLRDIISLSNKYKEMAICPGSWYEKEKGSTYHTSGIIFNGQVILKQRQLYLAKWEKELGLCRGSELDRISFRGLKLGILLSTDVFYPQVSRALAMSGAELVIAPTAVKGSGSMSRQLSGLWQNVQGNLFFGVESSFKGSFKGLEFRGASLIAAPLDMTGAEDGFLAQESEGMDSGIIIAELDNEKRQKAAKAFNTLGRLNRDAYRGIFASAEEGPAGFPAGLGGRHFRAAAVQRSLKSIRSIRQYSAVMEGFVKQAAGQGCDLIAFPEYNFLDLLGVIPGFSLINGYLNNRPAAHVDGGSDSSLSKLYPVLFWISGYMQSVVEKVMSRLANKYKIIIYTGSYFIKEKGGLYNGGAVISREGKIIGRQLKMHLTDFEEKLGIRRGDEFRVFDLDIGRLAFPVCMDASYYEVFSLARSRGCDAVVLPIANNEEYALHRALRGIWPRVQEAHVYGIKAALCGWFCGMHFTGKAGIFAPIGITPKGDGIVAISEQPEGDSLIVGNIDLEDLCEERQEDEYWGDCNADFEKAYYKKYYCSQ
jgi:predicted amidohydrolase